MYLNLGRIKLERATILVSGRLVDEHPDVISSGKTISTPVIVFIEGGEGRPGEWNREEIEGVAKREQEERREEEKEGEEEGEQKKQREEEKNGEEKREEKKQEPAVEVMHPNIGLPALLAPFRFFRTNPLNFLFLYTLWILGLVEEGISNPLNILIAPWILGNLLYLKFFYKMPIPTPPTVEMVAVEGEGESGSEEIDNKMPVPTPPPVGMVAEEEEEEARIVEYDWESDESEAGSEEPQWRVHRLEQRVQNMVWRVENRKSILKELEWRRNVVDRKLERFRWRESMVRMAEGVVKK